MQTIRFGCKKLILLFGLVLVILLKGDFALGQKFSEKMLYQKVNSNTRLNYEYREFQNSEESQTKPGLKSETKAFNLSFFGTLIPVGLGVGLGAVSLATDKSERGVAFLSVASAGIVIGPSLGYFYAGKSGRGLATAGLRFLLIPGVFLASFATCGWDCGEGDSGYDAAWVILIVGEALVVVSAVYDIATVKKAVRKKNQAWGDKNWMIAPKYFAESQTAGVELQFRF